MQTPAWRVWAMFYANPCTLLHTSLQLFAHENLSICSTPQLWRNCLHGAGASCSLWAKSICNGAAIRSWNSRAEWFRFQRQKILKPVKSKIHFNPTKCHLKRNIKEAGEFRTQRGFCQCECPTDVRLEPHRGAERRRQKAQPSNHTFVSAFFSMHTFIIFTLMWLPHPRLLSFPSCTSS